LLEGDLGWFKHHPVTSYSYVLSYWLVQLHFNVAAAAAGYHGSDGPLVVSDVMSTSLSEAFVVAGAELSHKFTDVNARSQQGMLNIACRFLFVTMLMVLLNLCH